MFADQFEPDGENYLYRKNSREAGIAATAAERDRLVARFDRDLKLQTRVAIIALVLLILSAAFYSVRMNIDVEQLPLRLALGSILTLFRPRKNKWCPGEDSNLHALASAST